MGTDDGLIQYYDQRAPQYEEIYRRDDPERRAELEAIAEVIRTRFAGRRVLEVACGTGYWTLIAAEVADRVVGVDASLRSLELASVKRVPRARFRHGDAYHLARVPGAFNAGLAMFWLSHVPRARMTDFLEAFHHRLGAAAAVVLADNVVLPGVGGELVLTGEEDSFKRRRLADGSVHTLLKNYFSPQELRDLLTPRSKDLQLHKGACYWWASYQTPERA